MELEREGLLRPKHLIHKLPPIKAICTGSGLARAFPGGRVTHPESQNEEENEEILRKNKKKWSKFGGKWGKWNSYPPGTVRLAMALCTGCTFYLPSMFTYQLQSIHFSTFQGRQGVLFLKDSTQASGTEMRILWPWFKCYNHSTTMLYNLTNHLI